MIDDRNETKRGILWLGSATALTRFLDVGSSLVVLALLTREQMGTAALVLSTGAIVEAVSGLGLGHALIQAKNLTKNEEQGLFWLSTAIGCLLGVSLLVVAPFVAAEYALPVLVPMIAVTGIKMLLVGAALVPHQLLSKHLMFREAGATQTLCTLGEGLLKIALSAAGFGAWSLVIANTMRGVVLLGTVLAFSGFRPRLHFLWREVKDHVSFGVRIAASGILYQGYRNAHYFLVGKLLGIEVLGVYRVAFDVGMQPLEITLNLINRVSYPIYARVAHEAEVLKAAFLRSTRSMTLFSAPLVAFLFFATEDLLAVVTHGRWGAAVPAVQILVWGGLVRGAAQLFPTMYVAAGRPNYAVLDSAVTLVVMVIAFWASLTYLPSWGVLSVCWVWVILYPLFLQMHLILARRIIALGVIEYLQSLAPGLGGALLMLVGMAVTLPLRLREYGALPSLFASGVVGLAVYSLYLRVVLKIGLRDLVPRRQLTAT